MYDLWRDLGNLPRFMRRLQSVTVLPGVRSRWVAEAGRAAVLDYSQVDGVEALKGLTGGRGPDVCIDAVGLEAHGFGPRPGSTAPIRRHAWRRTGRPRCGRSSRPVARVAWSR
ncbi:MAG TPA: SRPBCC family protein [Thermomicrobiaceae bacterium]|nr:SRPBCC family protein [Thermomicrobiaceae bacterium]